MDGTTTCGTYDGKDVVDFGSMGATGPFAYTCNDKSGGRFIESGIRFNTDKGQIFVSNPGSGCQAKHDLESIMTHERGHSYGLNHVSGDTHANLTMYPNVFKCDTRWRSLGNGDMRGLEVTTRSQAHGRRSLRILGRAGPGMGVADGAARG